MYVLFLVHKILEKHYVEKTNLLNYCYYVQPHNINLNISKKTGNNNVSSAWEQNDLHQVLATC